MECGTAASSYETACVLSLLCRSVVGIAAGDTAAKKVTAYRSTLHVQDGAGRWKRGTYSILAPYKTGKPAVMAMFVLLVVVARASSRFRRAPSVR